MTLHFDTISSISADLGSFSACEFQERGELVKIYKVISEVETRVSFG